MATGGFKPNAQTDFLEEWKAKREKMRAKMLGDIAAATGACTGGIVPASLGSHSNKSEMRNATSSTELNNNGNPDRGTSYPMARSSSSSALKRPDDDPHPTPAVRGADTLGSNLKKTPQPEKVPSTPQESSPTACNDHGSDKESPSPSKGKEKKNSGPSARKGKGQIEKRKLREKRRSTGVVSMPSTESLDELDDDDGGDKAKEEEQQLTQLNTEQNEAMTSDPGAATHLLQDTPRSGSGHHQSSSSGGPGSEEAAGGNSRHRRNRHGNAAAPGGLERRMEELEKELARQRQENGQLLKAQQDKDDLIGKLKEEIDLLNRDLDDIEDENEQLKQENKTLLKVVGQLTR
ncbi:PRKC apoptosis WT1 regulator protein isoform X1 [Salmo salar]|uniref:PRKC apoptosis WT1 regulator protein isoform X1 n=1 Tax=Salmo salar TaxID=8030 RepID=A0A1S3SH77_SALSA|nr:PRKC apoptosis WT1 regulator protein isoform X1 [Salmo salar]|eukprot:XP_014063691.1 PREDICTED: PRKC apoptosis WT1 regulator protein-like isoform X1 [Salmo salar]